MRVITIAFAALMLTGTVVGEVAAKGADASAALVRCADVARPTLNVR